MRDVTAVLWSMPTAFNTWEDSGPSPYKRHASPTIPPPLCFFCTVLGFVHVCNVQRKYLSSRSQASSESLGSGQPSEGSGQRSEGSFNSARAIAELDPAIISDAEDILEAARMLADDNVMSAVALLDKLLRPGELGGGCCCRDSYCRL
jgi:hypothetical protein